MQRCIMIQTITLPSTFLIQIKQPDSEAAGFWKKVRKYFNINLNILNPKVQEN